MANPLGIDDQSYGMLSLFGSAAGMTPEQYAASVQGPVTQAPTSAYETAQDKLALDYATQLGRRGGPNNTQISFANTPEGQYYSDLYERGIQQMNQAGPLSPEEQAMSWYTQGYQAQANANKQNQAAIGTLSAQQAATQSANQAAMDNIYGQLGWQDQQNVLLNNQTQALLGQLGTATTNANNFDWGNLGNYTNQINALSASNQGYMNNLGSAYQSMAQPLQSQVSWQGDLTSQAAQAYADPAAIAAQYAALSQLQGIAGGSLDVSLSGNEGYGQLLNYAHGGNQLDPWSVVGMKDLKDVYGGSLDLKPGQTDPAAYAAALDAMGKFKDLSTPTVTDAEKLIWETALQNQIQNDRANRQAVNSQLRQRGLSGAGQQIASTALANQINSENALLTSLSANANAVNRAMTALQGYGSMSSNLNAQANQLGEANQNTRMQALGQMSAIGANVAEGNANRQFAATGQAASLYESNAQNNANRRLSGAEASAQTAGQMRQQSFNEAYSRGAAADQTAQFNRAQSIDVAKFNSLYAQDERNAAWNRATDYTSLGLQTNQINATNAGNVFNAGASTNASTFGRTSGLINAQDQGNVRQNQLAQGQTDRRIGAAGTQMGLNNTGLGQQTQIAGLGIQNNLGAATAFNNFAGGMAGLSMNQAASTAAAKQAADAREAQKSNGLLGTPLLSQNGILGIQGVPFL